MLLKRGTPLKHKAIFEQDRAEEDGTAHGSAFRTSVTEKSQGPRYTKFQLLLGTCQVTYETLSTAWGLAQMVQAKKNLTWLFPGVLVWRPALLLLCGWNLLWRKRLSKLVFVWALSYQAHSGG